MANTLTSCSNYLHSRATYLPNWRYVVELHNATAPFRRIILAVNNTSLPLTQSNSPRPLTIDSKASTSLYDVALRYAPIPPQLLGPNIENIPIPGISSVYDRVVPLFTALTGNEVASPSLRRTRCIDPFLPAPIRRSRPRRSGHKFEQPVFGAELLVLFHQSPSCPASPPECRPRPVSTGRMYLLLLVPDSHWQSEFAPRRPTPVLVPSQKLDLRTVGWSASILLAGDPILGVGPLH